MKIEDIYRRIERYYDGDVHYPLVVDVPSYSSYENLINHFGVSGIGETMVSAYCVADEMPQWDLVKHELISKEGNWILSGISDYLKLEGKSRLKSFMRSLFDLSCSGRVVVVTIGCASLFDYRDPRIKASGRLLTLDGESEDLKALCFLAPDMVEPDVYINGLNKLNYLHKCNGDKVAVITNHRMSDFPESLYDIREFSNIYQVVITNWPICSALSESFGSAEQWKELNDILSGFGLLEAASIVFGGPENLGQAFSRFEEMSEFEKWYYLVCLKLLGVRDNEYLSKAARNSISVEDLAVHIYNDILSISPRKSTFRKIYDERKRLLVHLQTYSDVIERFCKSVWVKEESAISYLSDASVIEKEAIIAFLDRYGASMSKKKVMDVLEVVFPDLYVYMSEYCYSHPTLTEYFSLYRFCKATNHISDEMYALVQVQSEKREYNSILNPRSLIVDKIDKKDTVLIFMDALGAEYIPYLQYRFFEEGFYFKVTETRCELPSITSVNKDFVDVFKSIGCKVIDIKELDELKHEGGVAYDYTHTKLPIHIIKELKILDELIYYLKNHLAKGKKAIIIGDHGTSRLAVINERENKWEVAEKGIHSGRCCPMSEIDEKPEFAAEENGFWCLANYDRFKGGRKGLVEVHGGATFEEVTVPVIEVTKRDKKIHCEIRNEGPLKRSARIVPVLKLFVEKDCESVVVELSGRRYESRKTQVAYIHEVDLKDIKRPGTYLFDVYCDEVLIAKGLSVEVVNQGAQERSFF